MLCPKCGSQLEENAVECHCCKEQISPTLQVKKKNAMVGVMIAAGWLIVAVAFILILNSPVSSFQAALASGDSEHASQIYDERIQDNREYVKQSENALVTEVNAISEAYYNEEMTSEEAIYKLNSLSEYPIVAPKTDTVTSYIEEVETSRDYYRDGVEQISQKDYIDAYMSLIRVTQVDPAYYDQAQALMTEEADQFKEDVLTKVDDYVDENNYKKAIASLETALELFPNDEVFTNKLNEVSEEQYANDHDNLQKKADEQDVLTADEKLKQEDAYDVLEMTVRNTTDKTVAKTNVSILGFDADGNPVHIRGTSGNLEVRGYIETPIPPNGEIIDSTQLLHQRNLSKVISCVTSVEFTDGTEWENPYYEDWIDFYKGGTYQEMDLESGSSDTF